MKEPMSPAVLELVAARFRLLSEPTRLRIVQALQGGERTVGELTAMVLSTQPNVSKHLKILLDGGILSRRPVGAVAYYSIVDPVVFRLCEAVCDSLRERAGAQVALLKTAQGEVDAQTPRMEGPDW